MPGSGSSFSDYRLALPVDFQLEEYRIVRVLGQGGFGITYLAYDTRLAIEVAIKEMLPRDYATRIANFEIIPKSQSDQQRFAWSKQRFIEEARMLARLNHSNIVRVFRFLEHHGTACMVMEFVRGQNFLEWMQRHRKPTQQELNSVLLPLLDGLGYLHDGGLLHRDISPENIFITEQGRPMLLDFGSARATVDRDRILTGIVRAGYSPVEQYQTVEPQGPFTDLYALAGVMIHAITGHLPPLSMDRLGSRDPFEPLRQRYHDRYRENFLKALEAAFAVRPGDRLRSAAEWRRMLAGDFREPQPKSKQNRLPPPDKKVNRVSKARRKTPASPPKGKTPLWLFALVLIALAAVGVALYFSQSDRPERTPPQPLPWETPRPTLLTPLPILRPIPQAVTPRNATNSHAYANALGMEFVPVPGTTVLFCVHQTRKQDYAAYARAPHENPVDDKWENPEWRSVRVSGEDNHPVVMVNWYDANAFCEWLSEMESREKGYSLIYRLPTNEEWNAAVGSTRFPWGDVWPPPSSGLGNYWDETAAATFGPEVISIKPIPGYEDGFATTSPVKSFPPNRFGLYDLGSNVQEWCRDIDNGKVRRRGASWKDSTEDAVSSLNQELFSPPEQRSVFIGFRCVLERPTETANK